MKSISALFLTLIFCFASHASARVLHWQKGLRQLRTGQKVYVEYRPAVEGKPTLFFLNGLTWSTKEWQRLKHALDNIDPGLGLVLYDMRGMGKTLLEEPLDRDLILLQDQVEDLRALKENLNIQGPQSMVALSYGGAVALSYLAQFPKDFNKVIIMAPYLERLTDQDQILEFWITSHRLMYPFDLRTYDELYDHYLRILIYTTYPLMEPVLLENPYKLEATFRMVQGAKDFHAMDLANKFPADVLHVMGAEDDDFVKPEQLALFWEKVGPTAGSFLRIANTEHKIPFERPELAAAWIYQILIDNPQIAKGRIFTADPFAAEARSGDIVIPLKKAGFCESILRRVLGPF